jgi:hypothetical protein
LREEIYDVCIAIAMAIKILNIAVAFPKKIYTFRSAT